MSKTTSKLLITLINIFVFVILILCIEGVASYFFASRLLQHHEPAVFVAERVHTEFDPVLGWINQVNVYKENMYGDGIYLKTNSQAFRNDEDISLRKEKGKKRIVCAGDSFTLGYGVSNIQTWCHLLGQNGTKYETVNMGQGGYGADQAYLWYKRDGVKLQHDMLLFAFNTVTIRRMQTDNFYGASKPFFTLKNGKIHIDRPTKRDRGASSKWSVFLQSIKTSELVEKLVWKLKLWGSNDGVLSSTDFMIVEEMFEDLKEITQKHSAKLVLVHLPLAKDYPVNRHTDAIRKTLLKLSAEHEITYIDLVQSIDKIPSSFDVDMLFQYGNEHYSFKGNEFVANQLESKIADLLEEK